MCTYRLTCWTGRTHRRTYDGGGRYVKPRCAGRAFVGSFVRSFTDDGNKTMEFVRDGLATCGGDDETQLEIRCVGVFVRFNERMAIANERTDGSTNEYQGMCVRTYAPTYVRNERKRMHCTHSFVRSSRKH